MAIALVRSLTCRSLLAASLAAFLAATAGAQDSSALRILAVQGESARHNIRTHAVSPTVIEVRDLNNRLLPAAHVEFELPALGPGGHFADGSRKLTVLTDSLGRASMFGFVPNDQDGQFRVVVNAVSGARSASLGIVQYNMLYSGGVSPQALRPTRSTSGTKLLLLLVVGAVVAGGGIAAARGGSGNSAAVAATQPTATPSLGTITVGGPR